MNQILYTEKSDDSAEENNKKRNKKNGKKLIIICLIVCVIATGIVLNLLNKKIFANVYIGDTDVSMMTKEEAYSVLEPSVNSYKNSIVKLTLNGKTIQIKPADIDFELNESLETIVDTAFSYGREDGVIKNLCSLVKSCFSDKKYSYDYKYNEDKLNNIIKNFEKDLGIESKNTYSISGDMLMVKKESSSGLAIDRENTRECVIMALKNGISNVEASTYQKEYEIIDFDEIYNQIYILPENAEYVSGDKFVIISEKMGISFDRIEAQKIYDNANINETVEIPLVKTNPDITKKDIENNFFKTKLSTFSSSYDVTETEREKNLIRAAELCNDTVLYPGEEFSFCNTIGPITTKNGYAMGHSFAGGKVINSVGGGVCQVSSSLYNAVLMADLKVTLRYAHGMYVEYVKPALDATISENYLDFKFKNSRDYPIKIEAEAKNGNVVVSIYGVKKNNEPIIELESVILETIPYKTVEEKDSTLESGKKEVVQKPVNGYVAESYVIKKDSNGNVISRTLISKDKYSATNEIIKVGTKGSTNINEQSKEDNEIITDYETVIIETLPFQTIKQNDGTLEEGKTKVIQKGVDGYISERYLIKKTKNGDIISRTFISKDTINAMDEIIKVGTKKKNNEDYSDDEGLPDGWDSPESPYSKN